MTADIDGPPEGKRFTHVYLERGKPIQDSARMRRRLASLINSFKTFDAGEECLAARTERELGIPAPWSQNRSWEAFLAEWDLKDVLDFVTIAHQILIDNAKSSQYSSAIFRKHAQDWIAEVRRIFQEENVHYTVDVAGGVHFQFDGQFAHDRLASIASLQGGRYANARHVFEGAMKDFSKAPPDGKNAIRGVFSAAENVFKLITSKDRLGAKEVDDLGVILNTLYAADDTARHSARKMLLSLKDWVDAAHFYRHESGTEDVAQPPLPLAVYLVSAGAAHLRWLAELDAASVK